jgi:oligoendopeptidase F
MSTAETERLTGAETIEWNLADLYPGSESPEFQQDVTTLVPQAQAFKKKWHGSIASLTPARFLEMLKEYEHLLEIADRLGSFTQLQWSTDTEDPDLGALLQRVREVNAQAWRALVFVTVEMTAISDAEYATLCAAPELAQYKHWLDVMREYKPYTLSEDAEEVMAMKMVTSRASWVRMHDELLNAQSFTLNGKEFTQAAILKLLYEPNRDARRAASEAFAAGLKKGARHHAFIFNTIIADCSLNDHMRGYPTWISSRNMSNEVSDTTVQTLIDSVVARYDLVQRYYGLKKRLLDLDTMYEYDRYAPVGDDPAFWTWEEARALVVESYASFHPKAGEIAAMFFDNNWIHAPIRPGKSGGAYSAGTVPSAHPYVFMNFSGTSRDVQTLAHELGHGIHQYLSRPHGMLQADTPLTIAETASVFGEMIVFQKLLERTTTKAERLSLLTGKIEDAISTVFRQISLNRFEDACHNERRTKGELRLERFNELWLETQQLSFGDTVSFTDGYKHYWTYISHFIHTPGYVYAYAFGELLVLALYEVYRREGAAFPDKYMALLSSGGSKRPEELLAPLGIDINDPTFWNIGIASIERLIAEAESLA